MLMEIWHNFSGSEWTEHQSNEASQALTQKSTMNSVILGSGCFEDTFS